MLDANNALFEHQPWECWPNYGRASMPHPNGATIRDRLGRELYGVVAANLKTGEVILYGASPLAEFWVLFRWRLHGWKRMGRSGWYEPDMFVRRHCFYPAPLSTEPFKSMFDNPYSLSSSTTYDHD